MSRPAATRSRLNRVALPVVGTGLAAFNAALLAYFTLTYPDAAPDRPLLVSLATIMIVCTAAATTVVVIGPRVPESVRLGCALALAVTFGAFVMLPLARTTPTATMLITTTVAWIDGGAAIVLGSVVALCLTSRPPSA